MSRWTVQRQLKRMGYKSTLPYGTPMLTQKHKEARAQWAIQHKDDDWSRTIFTDETSYQLFRNTIRRWSKTPRDEVKRIPKNKQKIMIILSTMPGSNFIDDGDCSKIMIRSTEVRWLNNFYAKKYRK
ncbi:unnamed protein product [Rotaria socialis]